ncbi:MAG: DNA replication/repair protein RecF [Bacillota bacterium]|nr:DNA replication/repair protein RecF [Bacillota bacterium]
MYFKEIALENFRNYEKEKAEFHPSVNVILGNNAQGKTNLLEAIYINSLGRSFRTAKDSEMIRFGQERCRVKSRSVKGGREQTIELSFGKEGKEIKIDGVKENKSSALLERAYIVIFSPEDLKIVKDEPEKRRRFLDRELCQIKPVYYRTLGRYKKILQQRNALLKQGEADRQLFAAWDEALAAEGAPLIQYRNRFLEKLDKISREIHGRITDGKERLELAYEGNLALEKEVSLQRERFSERLQETFFEDLKRGTTGTGPHRDDFKISVDGVDVRHFGSQGQQRTAALSLKLAETELIREETGETPVLLLDDVLSELDPERQRFLIKSLSSLQLFISAAELSPLLERELAGGKIFLIEGGKIKKD